MNQRGFPVQVFQDGAGPGRRTGLPLNEGLNTPAPPGRHAISGARRAGGYGSQVCCLRWRTVRQIGGRRAWDQEWVRQRLAQFAIECEA